ncbi:hypothetical protein X777_03360 [Ooceraea biroi]|uniref:Uncharacterized protein n=1 Tax=Ooceraea biroi TaxID=2015173 RepID=A0A026X2T2_OOCBI|nr:hypothetical protein X777_03360 [Ooceraea biroi]
MLAIKIIRKLRWHKYVMPKEDKQRNTFHATATRTRSHNFCGFIFCDWPRDTSRTYENDYKIQDCPETGEVFTEA